MASASKLPEHTMLSASEQLELPRSAKIKIALCQLSVRSKKNQNLVRARNMIKIAAESGARIVVLPEMWNCPYSKDFFAKFAEDFDNDDASPTFSLLSEAASCHGITIVGGSVPEWSNGRLYNTSFVFGPDGKLRAKHRKIHLFDVDIPGDITFKESDIFTAGDRPTIVDTDAGCVGVGICHDIRFPELAMLYAAKGAHIICYPGAFNISTGELLWELMQRSRAADNQLFVATCSPSRDSCSGHAIWGHSTLVGPVSKFLDSNYVLFMNNEDGKSGEIIATSGHEENVIVAEIDYSKIELQRKSLPLDKQKRGDIYQFVDEYEEQKHQKNELMKRRSTRNNSIPL